MFFICHDRKQTRYIKMLTLKYAKFQNIGCDSEAEKIGNEPYKNYGLIAIGLKNILAKKTKLSNYLKSPLRLNGRMT